MAETARSSKPRALTRSRARRAVSSNAPSGSTRRAERPARRPAASRSGVCSTDSRLSIGVILVMPRDGSIMTYRPSDPELPLGALVRPYRRRWRLVLAICVGAWLAALLFALIPARRYTASVVLAAVPNTRNASLTGGLTALLGSAQLGGIQSTPYFIAKLLLLRSVVTDVAAERVGDSRGGTVIERV